MICCIRSMSSLRLALSSSEACSSLSLSYSAFDQQGSLVLPIWLVTFAESVWPGSE